jgi:hypothetical protein
VGGTCSGCHTLRGGGCDHLPGGALERASLDRRAEFGAVSGDALLGVVETGEDLDVDPLAHGRAQHIDALLEVSED